MVADGSLSFDSVSFDEKAWYEIDTVEDLMKAEKLFSQKKQFATESRNIRKYIPDKISDSLLKSTNDSMKSLIDHTPKVKDIIKDISIKTPKLNLGNI